MGEFVGNILMPQVTKDRGLILSVKRLLPERLYRNLTKPVSLILKFVPNQILYSVGMKQRIRKFPYCIIKDGDTVIQMGAPRDLLNVGRSRAVFFMNCVGKGKVVVFEPDPQSAEALEKFAEREGLSDRLLLIKKGAWSSECTVKFLSSPEHPAANLIKGTEDINQSDLYRRKYQEFDVPVTSLDNIVSEHQLSVPKLVSITTNGAESEILAGMEVLLTRGVPYISLAITGGGYPEMMSDIGYDLVALDDRGFTFKLKMDDCLV